MNTTPYIDILRTHPPQIKAGQDYVIDRFRPGDETGIAQCYFLTYGDSFPLEYVYNPAALLEANTNGSLYSVVARTKEGDIVSHASLFPSAPNPKILEGGGLMVLPGYRAGGIASQMTPRTLEELPRELGLDAIFVQAVCSHTHSQKGPAAGNLHPTALEIDVLENKKNNTRTALLDMFRVYTDHPHTVYLPSCVAGIIPLLYQDLNIERTIAPFSEKKPAGPTQLTTHQFSPANPVRMTIQTPGYDIAETIGSIEQDHPNTHAFQAILPLHNPAVGWATTILRNQGYRLGGLLPLWDGGDCLMLQKFTDQPDVDTINLIPQANILYKAVHQDMNGTAFQSGTPNRNAPLPK